MFEPRDFLAMVRAMGRQVTLRKEGASSYDPATDTTTATPADTLVDAALQTSTAEWQAGRLVRVDGQTALIPSHGLAVAPAENDLIIDGGVEWRILSIRDHKPGGTRVGWLCRLGG